MNIIAEHKEFYRRRLPHIDQPGRVQAITFRLADSLPKHVVESMLNDKLKPKDLRALRLVQEYLDSGHGECWLRKPRIAELVQNALFYFDGVRYNLVAWVIMPNHVHVIIETIQDYELRGIVHSWKSYTAHEANKILHRTGQFWYREYFDRYMRDADHLEIALNYLHNNPVAAGLVDYCTQWPYSSVMRFDPNRKD